MTFQEWVATKRWFDKLEDHAAGSSEGPGWGYQPGWIAVENDGWHTVASNHDYGDGDLASLEEWLWDNYAEEQVR